MTLNEYIEYLSKWLKDVNEKTKTNGYIFGLSGGLDSACVAGLLKKSVNQNCLALILPCHSNSKDVEDALLVAKTFNIPHLTIDLSSAFDELVKNLKDSDEIIANSKNKNALNNIKVRLRMVTLYALGQARNYLVCGTDNLDEWYTGYFTKYGDGGVDLVPLIHLTKGEVKEVSRLLGVPESIIKKVPSAGLYQGQTDESELGVSYDELDKYLLGKSIDKKKEEIIRRLHLSSEHKRRLAIQPKPFER